MLTTFRIWRKLARQVRLCPLAKNLVLGGIVRQKEQQLLGRYFSRDPQNPALDPARRTTNRAARSILALFLALSVANVHSRRSQFRKVLTWLAYGNKRADLLHYVRKLCLFTRDHSDEGHQHPADRAASGHYEFRPFGGDGIVLEGPQVQRFKQIWPVIFSKPAVIRPGRRDEDWPPDNLLTKFDV